MEVINHLLNYKNIKIYQNSDWFSFSLDSVLLSNFVTINRKINKIIDLGTGNAPIPLILSTRTNALIYGVEIQKEIFELAKKTIKINNKEDQIILINDDYRNIANKFETDTFDVLLCNPPYFEYSETSNLNFNMIKTTARHEIFGKLEDIFKISKKVLKNNGLLAMVNRTDRLVEIIMLMKQYNIEPKKIRFIYPKRDRESNLVLIQGRKNGNKGLKILSPLYVHDKNGNYTKEIRKMFGE